MGSVTYLWDRFSNLVSSLGTLKDKSSHNTRVFLQLTAYELETMYRSDWMSRKIVDIPPFDMVRNWRDWYAEDDQIELIEEEETRLGVRVKIAKAEGYARLYGGGMLLLGYGDRDPSSEVPIERIGKGGLKYLNVLSRYDGISPGDPNTDPTSEFYGQPDYYEANIDSRKVRIHPSRIIRFLGNEYPTSSLQVDQWSDSILQVVNDALQDIGVTIQSVTSMVNDAKLDVIGIPDMSINLSSDPGYADRLHQRFALANQMKSINNMLLLDKAEEFDRKATNFGSLDSLIMTYLQIVSGAADIPVTRFLGQSPAGFQSTGESDIRNYYDRLKANQELKLRPALSRLDESLIRSALGSRPPEIYYDWAPLWQLSEKEKAEISKITADTAKVYLDSGLVPEDALQVSVCNTLIEQGVFVGIEAALKDAQKEPGEHILSSMEEAEAKEMEKLEAAAEAAKARAQSPNPPNNPPPPPNNQ